jgi:prepilin-type N-terminal cleavage/methylation domain-containing protein
MKHPSNKYKNSGFTLVEVMVAIFVFVVGITAVIYLIAKETSFVKTSDDRLTAVYLAQEGIELVRNIREENWINGRGWRTGPGDPMTTGGEFPCNIPPGSDVTKQCRDLINDVPPDEDGYIIDYTSGLGLATYDPPTLCFYPGDRGSAPAGLLGFVYNADCPGADEGTRFKRVIYFLTYPGEPWKLKVTSVVRWGDPERSFEVSEILYDWNKQD